VKLGPGKATIGNSIETVLVTVKKLLTNVHTVPEAGGVAGLGHVSG
jgi:hypothetical protein